MNAKLKALAMGTALTTSLLLSAHAQSKFPHPITIIVSLPAGSTTDTLTRKYAELLGREAGVPIVIENVPGAQGVVAARRAAAADEWTLFVAYNGMFLPLGDNEKDLQWDPKLYPAVSTLGYSDLQIAVHKGMPVTSIDELVEYARTNKVDIGASDGSAKVFARALVKSRRMDSVVIVPYKGDPDSVRETVAQQTCCVVAMATVMKSFVESGDLRVLGPVSMDPKARPLSFIVGSPRMKPETRAVLSELTRKALQDPQLRAFFELNKTEAAGSTPEKTDEFINEQIELGARLIEQAGPAQQK